MATHSLLKLVICRAALLAVVSALFCDGARAQEGRRNRAGRSSGSSSPMMSIDVSQLTPEQRAQYEAAMRARGMNSPGGGPQPAANPAEETKPAEGEKPKEEKKDEVETVKRSDSGPADPEELKAKPDENGMVQFSFRNQPWTDVLQWYADVSSSSLDWQELPADKLNLVTHRRHSLDQTRDLLNRYLLARGFTMLKQGDVLTVVKVDKIDPALVPRVEPDDLEEMLAYDFARVRFDLPDEMDPAKAVEDVKVLLTPTAKVTPLLASKQLMVIDAVANLRDVRDLVYGEQLAAAGDVRPELFPIRYRRAEYIADQIMIVLGLDPSSRKTPMEMQIEQQRMQLLMQMQGNGKDITNLLRQDGPPVFLAVDRRRNTVSVNAPKKEMAIIKRVIEQFDVPGAGGVSESAGDELTTRRYQTASVSPDAIVTALKEIANLSPLSQLQSDSSSKTIFATATAADHQTIQAMIDKLDGSGRELQVVWLSRRSQADQIAGTIQALMVGEKKEENNNRRGYYSYYGFGGDDDEDEPESGFRIQADVENNRLILMATKDEFAEVNKMLSELGVVTSQRGGKPETWRVLDARTPEETEELVKRLREAWGGSNPLNINVAPPAQAPASQKPATQTPATQTPASETPAAGPATDESTAADEDTLTWSGVRRERDLHPTGGQRSPFRLVQTAAAKAPEPTADEPVGDDVEPGDEDDEPGEPGDPDKPGDPSDPVDPDESAPGTAAAATAMAQAGLSSAGAASDPGAPSPSDAPAASSSSPSGSAPPINLTVTPDGRIVISSDDPLALDQLEDLMSELAPPQKDFKIYKLENSDCLDMWYNLKDYFEDELAEDDNSYWSFWDDSSDEDQQATLGKRRKLRFIYDLATNTVLVQNASPAQIQTIDKLVQIYDQPPAEDSVRQRRTEIVQVKYSRAQDIATALKEVYRDLLSSKDKEFQGRDGNQRGNGRREITYRFPGSENNKSAPVKVAFEGALSIGVDAISNTLIISAEDQIVNDVRTIIDKLDEQAKPDTVVQVHRITGSLDAEELQQALSTALSRPWPGGKPEANAAQNGRGGDRGNWEGGDRRRGDRGGRNRDRGDD